MQLSSLFYSPFQLQISISLDPGAARGRQRPLEAFTELCSQPQEGSACYKPLFISLWGRWVKSLSPTPAQRSPCTQKLGVFQHSRPGEGIQRPERAVLSVSHGWGCCPPSAVGSTGVAGTENWAEISVLV